MIIRQKSEMDNMRVSQVAELREHLIMVSKAAIIVAAAPSTGPNQTHIFSSSASRAVVCPEPWPDVVELSFEPNLPSVRFPSAREGSSLLDVSLVSGFTSAVNGDGFSGGEVFLPERLLPVAELDDSEMLLGVSLGVAFVAEKESFPRKSWILYTQDPSRL